jgi:hypothetical protein
MIISLFLITAGTGTVIEYRKDAHEAGENCL